MLPDGLKELLILQDRDIRRVQVEKNLAALPHERAAVENKISAHHAGIEAAKQEVIAVELRKSEIEANLASLEEQLRKYKSQQLMIKKNDEYQALTLEIERAEENIGKTEETEIEILYELDDAKEKAAKAEAELNEEIAAEQAQLARLDEREVALGQSVEEARAEVEKARSAVQESHAARYDLLARTIGLPVVVALRDQKCGGCHLKVSTGVNSEVRKATEIVSCGNCTRILFLETS